jgi:hypothetical protein
MKQHRETIQQFAGHEEELQSYIEWFKTLPLFYESGGLRVVHACWDFDSIRVLTEVLGGNRLNDNSLHEAFNGDTELFNALEVTLKGKELKLPAGCFFTDKDGNKRMEIRLKWWLDADGGTYKDLSIIENPHLPTTNVPRNDAEPHYWETEVPVFFGHYCLQPGPFLFRSNICCLDYSVADRGKLVAYRFEGEPALVNKSFVC